MIVTILQLILCNPQMLEWMREQAQKSDTPIDDIGIKVLEILLCNQKG